MRLTCLSLILMTALLSGCGNGYMLYETRYIPEPGERISTAEYAQLPWKEPYINGQSAPHSPTRDAIPRYQKPIIYGTDRDPKAFAHDGDYSQSGKGYQTRERIENDDKDVPAKAPKIKPF